MDVVEASFFLLPCAAEVEDLDADLRGFATFAGASTTPPPGGDASAGVTFFLGMRLTSSILRIGLITAAEPLIWAPVAHSHLGAINRF
jgi:hypothetical protein